MIQYAIDRDRDTAGDGITVDVEGQYYIIAASGNQNGNNSNNSLHNLRVGIRKYTPVFFY